MKLEIINSNNWLEATWYEEISTEENISRVQIHCESFSGHKEHIEMLRNKAKEYDTSLDEYEDVIKEASDSFVYPTQEELDKEELANKIQEAKQYLASTDYIIAKYNDLVTISGSMSKSDFIAKYKDIYDARDEARRLINEVR